jgi:hypothetical protein
LIREVVSKRRLDEIRYKLRRLAAEGDDAFFFPIRHAALVKLEAELASREPPSDDEPHGGAAPPPR